MPKALLILFGGRSIPNALTMIYEKPDLIVPIISKDVLKDLPDLERLIVTLLTEKKPILDTSFVVDAFEVEAICDQCQNAVKAHPGYDWTFNITSGTAIMSIGAYEAAKELEHEGYSINCWYMNTKDTNVVSLLGNKTPDEAIFDISVEQYTATYSYRLELGNIGNQRKLAEEKWLPFALKLVQQLENIDTLKAVLQEMQIENRRRREEERALKESKKPPINIDSQVYSLNTNSAYPLLEAAYNMGLLNTLSRKGKTISIDIAPHQFNFLNGSWLEVYVWNEINKLNIFTDCQWNQMLYPLHTPLAKKNLNELDVAMIYKAQMFFVECKAGREAFSAETLNTFDSVANTLGGNFVTKILVTSLPEQSNNQHFLDLIHARKIVPITREKLTRVGEIVREQVKEPKHTRM